MERVEDKVVEEGQVVEILDEVRVFCRDVLLEEVGSLEQLVARLAPELALGLLLDVRERDPGDLLVDVLSSDLGRVERASVEQDRELAIQVLLED